MPPRINSANLLRYQCEHCTRRCYTTHGLTQHINSHHLRDDLLRPSPPPNPIPSLDDPDNDALADFMSALRDTQSTLEDPPLPFNPPQRSGVVIEHSLINGMHVFASTILRVNSDPWY